MYSNNEDHSTLLQKNFKLIYLMVYFLNNMLAILRPYFGTTGALF